MAGAQPGRTPFTVVQLATSGLDDAPKVHSVILRSADAERGAVSFFTDLRSAKIKEMRRQPRVSLIGYDADAGFQIRLEGKATIDKGREKAAAWAACRSHTRALFQHTLPSGTPIAAPAEAAPADDGEGERHFAVVVVSIIRIDWLDISGPLHLRAVFQRDGSDWRLGWLRPRAARLALRAARRGVRPVRWRDCAKARPRRVGSSASRIWGERGDMLAKASSEDAPDDLTTRERIKRAARNLFALNGVDAVAVRDIVREAGGKNVSALNYYFGSKEELIESLIRDALSAANGRWDAALAALEAAGGPNSVREVVEILVLRGVPPNAGEGDEASARFFATLLHTRRRLVTDTVAKLELYAYDRALRHIRRLMPPMSEGAKDQRLLFYFWASSSIFAVLEGALDENQNYAEPWSAPDPLRHFIDAAVAMLEAPLTSPIEDVRKG